MKYNKKKYDFIDRRFLNQGKYHTSAAIIGKIELGNFGDKYPDGTFNISDCNRTIYLDIDTYSKKDIENSIYKMNQIIEVAQNMKAHLEEVKPYVEYIKKEELKKKEKKRKIANRSNG